MKRHLADLVCVIMNRLDETPEIPPSENALRRWLAWQGYNPADIDTALKMVGPTLRRHLQEAPQRRPGVVRHLSYFERCKLAPEARDALARLELYELIDVPELEMLLERLGQFEGEVGMDELDYLLSWLLCNSRDVESQQTLLNAFEGNSANLH